MRRARPGSPTSRTRKRPSPRRRTDPSGTWWLRINVLMTVTVCGMPKRMSTAPGSSPASKRNLPRRVSAGAGAEGAGGSADRPSAAPSSTGTITERTCSNVASARAEPAPVTGSRKST